MDQVVTNRVGPDEVRSDFHELDRGEGAQSGLGRLGSTRQVGKMANRIVIVIFAGFTLLSNLMLLLLLRVLFATTWIFALAVLFIDVYICFLLRSLIFALVVRFLLAFCFYEGCC